MLVFLMRSSMWSSLLFSLCCTTTTIPNHGGAYKTRVRHVQQNTYNQNDISDYAVSPLTISPGGGTKASKPRNAFSAWVISTFVRYDLDMARELCPTSCITVSSRTG